MRAHIWDPGGPDCSLAKTLSFFLSFFTVASEIGFRLVYCFIAWEPLFGPLGAYTVPVPTVKRPVQYCTSLAELEHMESTKGHTSQYGDAQLLACWKSTIMGMWNCGGWSWCDLIGER